MTPWTYLRHLRLRKGLTIPAAAAGIGVAVGHLYALEAGKHAPTDATLLAIASFYEIDPVALDEARVKTLRKPRSGAKARRPAREAA